jgi:hypothetical protein
MIAKEDVGMPVQIKMLTIKIKDMQASNFEVYANRHCEASKMAPDQKTIDLVINAARKKPLRGNAVILARHDWMKRHKLQLPLDMDLANFCLMIKDGKPYRAFYSNTMTHVIKKLNYNIQVLN